MAPAGSGTGWIPAASGEDATDQATSIPNYQLTSHDCDIRSTLQTGRVAADADALPASSSEPDHGPRAYELTSSARPAGSNVPEQ